MNRMACCLPPLYVGILSKAWDSISTKRLQCRKERCWHLLSLASKGRAIAPKVSHIGFVYNYSNQPFIPPSLDSASTTGRFLRIRNRMKVVTSAWTLWVLSKTSLYLLQLLLFTSRDQFGFRRLSMYDNNVRLDWSGPWTKSSIFCNICLIAAIYCLQVIVLSA